MTSIIGKHKSFFYLRFKISNICSAVYPHLSGDTPILNNGSKEKRQREAISCRIGRPSLQNISTFSNIIHLTSRISFPAHRQYSSAPRNNRETIEFSPASSKSEFPLQDSDAGGINLSDIFNQVYHSTLDAANNAGKLVNKAAEEAGPHIDRLYESHPYLKEIVVPVGWTLSATALAWLVLPRMLRKFHHYTNQTPFAVLSGSLTQEVIPYEKSLWGSLEDPTRYLITFVAFSQLSVFIAPTISQYLSQAWRGALVLSVVWFLHRWKTSLLSVALAKKMSSGAERDRLVALDKLSSVGLFTLGIMALAEACGIAVQSILTVGGIGGVATAFAAKDILGNLLSGLSLQFSQPFSIGDSIKAGSVEGRVVGMGLTTTSLISKENFPTIVPNSLFSSQVIVNKSRAQYRTFLNTVPFSIEDLEKIPHISENVKSMLRSHPAVVIEREAPHCFLSRIEESYAELTFGCTLRNKGKAEFYSTGQDLLLQVTQIILQHGAKLGNIPTNVSNR